MITCLTILCKPLNVKNSESIVMKYMHDTFLKIIYRKNMYLYVFIAVEGKLLPDP